MIKFKMQYHLDKKHIVYNQHITDDCKVRY